MLEADLPRRLLAVAASGGVGLFYLSPLQVAVYLGLYYPCDLLLVFALRRLSARPDATWRLRLMQLAAFCNMSAFLVPAVMLWLEPGASPKLGAALFVFGGMLSVMLVRAAFMPMTVANSLPLAGFVGVIAFIERETAEGREQLFLALCVLLLSGYFVMTLRSALQINRALSVARDQALARVATQRRFLATMSHELRTPLNGILGMAQELVSSHPGSGAEVIRDSARDMAAMVGDLLDNAAIEAGAVRVKPLPTDTRDLLRRVEDRWLPAFKAKGLTLRLSTAPDVPDRLMLDPLRVMQCLSNLLANALRHTREGGAELVIRTQGQRLVASVTDTGPGLPADFEAQLFQPFVALENDLPDSGPSTGLGLSICQGLAQAMGGDVTYERPAQGGSRFHLTIATSVPHPSDLPATDAAKPCRSDVDDQTRPRALTGFQGMHLLVVDDIATNRLVLRLALTSLGVTSDEAVSGDEALRLISDNPDAPYDAVLMDVRMPGLSGFDTLALMRKQGFTCPVFAVSADTAPEEQSEALSHGFDGYLTKPVELAHLSALLRQGLAPARGSL